MAVPPAAAGAAATDRQADFHHIYTEHGPAVFRFLRAREGHQAAEDHTAETFARAWTALDRFEDRGISIRAWLIRIAYNLLVDDSRAGRRAETPVDEVPDTNAATGAETEALRTERSRAVRAAIDEIPEAYRVVVRLRYLDELSVEETAEVLGLTRDVVRTRCTRGLKALRASSQLAAWIGD